jgi:hypothetical protein
MGSSNHGGMHRFVFTIKSTLSVFHVGVYIIRTEDMSICGSGVRGVRGGRVVL